MNRPAHPSAFDVELDSERGRWLRRRFLWYCAISVLLSLPFFPGEIDAIRGVNGATRIAAIVFNGALLLNFILFAAAFAYAWNSPPSRSRILRMALWLGCVSGILPMVCLRISVAIEPHAVLGGSMHAVDHPSRELPPDLRLTPQTLALLMSEYLLFVAHLFPCVFIPWTVRESLPLTGSLLGVFFLIGVCDLATGRLHPIFLGIGIALLALVLVLPGLAICWRRHRTFKKTFVLRFESRGYRKLQKELADARRVHESCMPEQISAGPIRLHYVYEPMRQIGGDLLFVAPRNGDSVVTAVLLDVTGHGIAAALTVNRIVGELHRIFGEDPDAPPASVLSALNRYVCVTLSRHDLYMSAICLRLDASRDLLDYANCGHPSAFLRRAGGQIDRLDSTAFLLGLDGRDGFESNPVALPFHAGDALIAYTDGAAEAKDGRNTMLGMDGVQRLLERIASEQKAPADWPGDILRRVFDYRGAPPDDDTLVVALFRPKSI